MPGTSAIHRKQFGRLIAFWFGVRRSLWIRCQYAKGAGLSNNQYELVLAVKAWEDKRSNTALMAGRLLLEHHVVAPLVKSLSAQQLLPVEPSRSDRRSLALSLTPKASGCLRTSRAEAWRHWRRKAPVW
jgi:DNA-binding MarR family transcriptional regulator